MGSLLFWNTCWGRWTPPGGQIRGTSLFFFLFHLSSWPSYTIPFSQCLYRLTSWLFPSLMAALCLLLKPLNGRVPQTSEHLFSSPSTHVPQTWNSIAILMILQLICPAQIASLDSRYASHMTSPLRCFAGIPCLPCPKPNSWFPQSLRSLTLPLVFPISVHGLPFTQGPKPEICMSLFDHSLWLKIQVPFMAVKALHDLSRVYFSNFISCCDPFSHHSPAT